MQLKLSFATVVLLATVSVQAEDFVSVQYLQYDESQNRTTVSAPSIMFNKDFGTDYTLNVSLVADGVSGASRNYYIDSSSDSYSSASPTADADSGASALARAIGVDFKDVKYENTEYSDTRGSISALLTTRFENRDELSVGISRSSESDFYSSEISSEYMHWIGGSKNQSLSFGASLQINEILKRCSDVDGCSGASGSMDATAINTQISYFQNIDSDSYAKISLFLSNDDGYLTNPYLNVVRNYNGATADVVNENRPDTKLAYGIALKYANALTENLSLHLGYRFYKDDWGIDSHTLDSDIFYELGEDWIFKLGLRSYIQSEADFYSGEYDYFTNELYASSDQRLSDFNALTYKTGINYAIDEDLDINFNANYYKQSTNLSASYFVTGFTYKF